MVLRSGIIIPFQFRDAKKLLMIGVPEENRDLSIWDLKNVVRAAFGIYNFEFRNKKIGFNIPDELLLHYLAQRHDLTNFVIEIGQASEDPGSKVRDGVSLGSFCPATVQKVALASPNGKQHVHLKSPGNNSEHSSNIDTPPLKIRVSQPYAAQTPESMTQSIDPMDIIPKSEQDENEDSLLQQQQGQQQQLQQQQQHANASSYFNNYVTHCGQGILMSANQLHSSAVTVSQTQAQAQPHQYSPAMINRLRRRGERMSKDQKELYVKYFEENPCMLTQRRNDIMLEPHWNKLSTMLNSVPQGAVKNTEEWKQTFDAWRYRVFMYTRYNSKLTGLASQNPKNYKPLTPTDQRAYAMWTSHKNTAPQDYDKIDMFSHLDETQADYDY